MSSDKQYVCPLRTPDEILQGLSEARELLLEKVIAEIAKTVETNYSWRFGEIKVTIYSTKSMMDAIREKLDDRLDAKGWALVEIDFFGDQRDGDKCIVRIAQKS
jgi:F0F1-type ATP synthase delta subunit